MTRHRLSRPLLSIALAGLLSAAGASAQIEYTVERIVPDPGAYSTIGTSMNDLGEVVGWSQFFGGGPGLRAWVWTSDTGLTFLPTPPFQSNARGMDINDAGVVAGDGGYDSGSAWRWDGSYTQLPLFDGDSVGTAGGINEAGQIAGTSRNGGSFLDPPHAFVDTPGGPFEMTTDGGWGIRINEAGQSVGYASNVAWIHTPGSGTQFIGPLGSKPLTWAWGVNDAGTVVGEAAQLNGNGHVPWIWSEAEGIQEIGNFGGKAAAVDVNDAGQVIGSYAPGPNQPWVWTEASGVRFLANLIDPAENLGILDAVKINDSGQILCRVIDQLTADRFPVVLTPVGDPSPWVSLGGGSPGEKGVPDLGAAGSLEAGSTVDVTLVKAPFSALTLLWLSTSSTPVNVLGGTLYANPAVAQKLIQAGATGSIFFSTTWPAGIPAGTELWLQFVVQDATVPDGLTLSDAVMAVTP